MEVKSNLTIKDVNFINIKIVLLNYLKLASITK